MAPTINLTSGAGWPFMVAGICIFSAAWVAPYAVMRWRHVRGDRVLLAVLQEDPALRMMVGFTVFSLGVSAFCCVGWIRALMISAGEFADLALFTRWARIWIMPPSSLAVCFGSAMVIWDAIGGRGYKACIILTLAAGLLWFTGNMLGEMFIDWYWPGH